VQARSGFLGVIKVEVRRVAADARHVRIERIGVGLDSHQRQFQGGLPPLLGS
jgi:hypothetical protein